MPKRKKFYMAPETFREIRDRLKITQAQAGKLIGVETQRISKWERGFAPVPEYAVNVYRLAEQLNLYIE